MSIYSEAYWMYNNDGCQLGKKYETQADPTETIVELLVELKLGQQDAFTYDQHNIDPKNAMKATTFQIDLQNEWNSMQFFRKNSRIYFPDFFSHFESAPLEILSPPPDRNLSYSSIYI
jgi:hypothetical protein